MKMCAQFIYTHGTHIGKFKATEIICAAAAAAKSLQKCPIPCYPIDGSPPGSSVPGILQARILEWVAISFSEIICRKRKMSCNSLEKKAGQGLEEEEQYIIYLLSLLH